MIPKLWQCQILRKATGNICDRLWHLSRRGQKVNGTTGLKTTQMLPKNKAWPIRNSDKFSWISDSLNDVSWGWHKNMGVISCAYISRTMEFWNLCSTYTTHDIIQRTIIPKQELLWICIGRLQASGAFCPFPKKLPELLCKECKVEEYYRHSQSSVEFRGKNCLYTLLLKLPPYDVFFLLSMGHRSARRRTCVYMYPTT